MKTKYIFTLISLLLITNIFAQSNLNEYQFVVVPKKYDFLKENDKYQLNSLTKFLLEKENFMVFFDDNLPGDIANKGCSGLSVNVLDNGNMLKTKLIVELKNCNNKIVFTSKEGVSKNKDYKKGYHEALRDAFQSLKAINYTYKPKLVEQEVVEVKPKVEPVVAIPVLKETPIGEVVSKPKELKPIKEKPMMEQNAPSNILYAQAINNGFQVVDSTPKVVMILVSTPKQDVFIVKGEDAIVYKEDGFWYKSKNTASTETLNIKF